ncbi:MATE family efflux transporter [Actinoallomurus rhizosphaericola]|uniref:MATE family efflux transporter n=1 Tax=Actinoallomurus rhizosphaericola TaxID=2952536 RepID=UPI0020936BB1|nr:MATE family efflux transporter [Actinoallomurus rhizosphaericola]MCO5998243.1 MATE family efflux transporter [Actinoallomurus rhizosphaericola]
MRRDQNGQVDRSPVSGRRIWAISLPLLLAEVGEAVIHVTDTALLARLGTLQLGAIALADEAHEIWLAPAVGLAQGLQIQIARRVGERRGDAMLAAFRRGFALTAVLGAALSIGLALAAPHVGELLAPPGRMGDAIGSFLRISALGLFVEALNLAYGGLVVGTARTRILIVVTSQVALTNFLFGYVLIFGRLGLPALGMDGAAWAYVITEAITFVILSGYIRRRYGPWYRRRSGAPSEAGGARPLLRLALPVALDVLLDSTRWLAFFLIISRVSQDMLAMSNVVYSVFNVLILPTDAFRETVVSLVSRLIGFGRGSRIGAFMRAIVPRGYLATLPLAAVTSLFPGIVLSIFGSDVTGIAGGETALRLVALSMLLVAPAEMWLAVLEGAAATDTALILSVVWTAIVLGWAYVATSAGLDLPYLWLGIPVGSAVTLVAAYLWVHGEHWRHRSI